MELVTVLSVVLQVFCSPLFKKKKTSIHLCPLSWLLPHLAAKLRSRGSSHSRVAFVYFCLCVTGMLLLCLR